MPSQHFDIDLGQAAPTKVIKEGQVALSMIITECTPGVRYETRFGTNGDWQGPYEGVGVVPRSFQFGSGLPLSDVNRGVFVRPVIATPGAVLRLDAYFGDAS